MAELLVNLKFSKVEGFDGLTVGKTYAVIDSCERYFEITNDYGVDLSIYKQGSRCDYDVIEMYVAPYSLPRGTAPSGPIFAQPVINGRTLPNNVTFTYKDGVIRVSFVIESDEDMTALDDLLDGKVSVCAGFNVVEDGKSLRNYELKDEYYTFVIVGIDSAVDSLTEVTLEGRATE